MAYRIGDRYQLGMFPESIEDYVAKDAPVRVYDAFVDALDFKELGIEINSTKVGNSEYHPRTMMKLLVYGYSYGVKSSRRLELMTHNDVTFIWLMGGLKPDHKTIAEFRRRHKGSLAKVLKQCARLCIKLNLIGGNVLFVDGTKIRANASRDATHDTAWYEKRLAELDQRIEQLLEECEGQDQREDGLGTFAAMNKELAGTENLKRTVQEALEEMKTTGKKKINSTDPDCAIMRSIQGSHAGYNVQSVVDDKHGLIVHAKAESETGDVNQFSCQVEAANEVLGKNCEVACADAGYANTEELEKIDAQGIKVVVPSQRQALHKEESPFSKSHFTYDKENDCYYCPMGHRLTHRSTCKKTGKRTYKIAQPKHCRSCVNWGQCTSSKEGRKLVRLKNEEVKQRLEDQYEEPDSQEVYARRKARVEHPFGHIKRNLKTDAFMMRGSDGVQAETSILATCFNLTRMISLLGIETLLWNLGVIAKEIAV